MPNYRRALIPGATYFFTIVTFKREGILTIPESRQILRDVLNEVKRQHPFKVDAWVLLPEHIHCIWTLPIGDQDYSKRWGLIKAGFSKQARGLFHREKWMTDSKQKHRETTIWQRRFWEHTIRDQDDLRKHIDYIHFNPVKHGHVKCVKDWPYSTFHRYVANGIYPHDWCSDDKDGMGDDFGE